ncbi:hypothetical protein QTO34_002256 [Cnephaeus nilssonii]|uniref:Uncharacterized protein n=1 Tax=Cnephaeus nilssonii TaxID=3371016 RepID=A0AA40HUC0_CNENI|nr:hypothetical protein QTO34_002256 [Eptesicus nilssonii]
MDDFHTCISPYVSHLSRIVPSASTDLQYYTCYFIRAPQLLIVLEVWYLETANYAICEEIILQMASWPKSLQTAAVVNTNLNLIFIADHSLSQEHGEPDCWGAPLQPPVQFSLLYSKFHLFSVAMWAVLLSTYFKFINLFLETKATIQGMLWASQLCSADVELQ